MSEYGAIIRWQKAQDEAFSDNQYSRATHGSSMVVLLYLLHPLHMLCHYRCR